MKRFFYWIWLWLPTLAVAQNIKLSEQPDAYIADAQAMMAATRNPQLIQSAKSLEVLWANPAFSAEHKTKLIALSKSMLTKGYKQNPYFFLLYEGVINAVTVQNLPAVELSNFLDVAKRTAETSDSKTFNRLLEVARQLFSNRLVYASNYNKLYAQGGVLSIRFNEQNIPVTTPDTQPQAKPNFEDDGWGSEPTAPAPANSPNPTEAPPQVLAVGPVFEFKNVNLTVVTASDSITLFSTDGTLGIKEGLWLGQKGRFTWQEVGLPDTYAVLEKYTLETRNPKITAFDATLTYSDKLSAPVKGSFEYQSKKRPKNSPASYPRFMSERNDVVIKNLGTDIEYRGGFSLFGNKIYSSSVNDKYATITVRKGGKVAFRTSSKRFELTDSLITSPLASVSVYLGGDSLFHPSIKLQYNRRMMFLRTGKVEKGGFRDTPYADGYHKMEILSDAMYWDLNKGKIDFYILSGKNVVPAIFESFDYFDPERYAGLSSQFGFHPLQLLTNVMRQKNATAIGLSELVGSSGRPYAQMRDAILNMVQAGMVDFDENTETIRLSRKGQHYVQAYARKKDYDTFLIPSFYGGSTRDSTGNATINLKDNMLVIRGVNQFQVSDSLRVFLTPRDKELRMGMDRNFTMTGELKTGNFRFRAQQFTFSYKDFLVDMNKIDSITFIPQKVIAKGGKTEVGGDLRYGSGKIYINRADNKSGRQRANDYPRLVIPEGVTVYFDQPNRGVAYDRKQVYFKIPTVDYDSLNVKDIDFTGTFYSGGIFPPFQETLETMADNSLGFVHKAPTGSYKLYGGASSVKFASELKMDKNGLQTSGELSHMTALLQTKEILFTPDSLTAVGTAGEIKEGMSGKAVFPKVDIKNFTLKWIPKADSMTIANRGGNFDFYNATTKLSGKLLVRNTGLFGFGVIKRGDSETSSDRLKFNKDAFLAERAEFKIGSNLTMSKPVLLGTNVDVNFGVATNLVNIKTPKSAGIGDSTGLTFPFASYKTSISSADWNITAKSITMKGDVKTSTFASLEPDQEGLSFNAAAATYDIEKMTLNVSGVPYIKSADAKIIPDKGLVTIRRDAQMQAFKNATLLLDTLNEYHRLGQGSIQIISRRQFEGEAVYQYVHARGDTSKIKMGNFELKEKSLATNDPKKKEKAFYTVAKSSITEAETFRVSPKLRYKGDITMLASEKNLQLDGFVQPQLKKRPDLDFWIPYKATNSENALIQVNKDLKGDGNLNLVAGLHFRTGTSGLYTTFLSPKEDARDEDLFVASGVLNDLAKEKQFDIVSPEKAANKLAEGNRYVFDDGKGVINLEGRFEVFKPSESVLMAGSARVHLDSAKYEFNQMMALNFALPPQALSDMSEKIVKTNLDERNTDKEAEENRDRLLTKLAALYGTKASELYRDRSANEHVPLYQVFPKLNTTMVLSNLNLRWNEDQSAFYSVGRLGVANIGNTDVNAQMEGFLELRKTQAGDELTVYLEASPEVWYYLSYRENQLGVVSSDLELNNLIMAKASKGAKGKEYTFTPVGEDEKMLFVERFTETYKPKPKVEKKVAAKKEDPKKKPAEKKKEETKEGF